MNLLVDVFAFLSVMLRSVMLIGAALTVGTVAFRHLVVAPALDWGTGPARAVLVRITRLLRASGWLLAAAAGTTAVLDGAVMLGTLGLPLMIALTAPSTLAALAVTAAALVLGCDSAVTSKRAPLAALVIVTGMVSTTHAVTRLDHSALLVGVSALHQIGAYLWLGGLLPFLIVLRRAAPAQRARCAVRYSRVCAIAVSLIALSAAGKAWAYIGSVTAVYGSQYGAMSATKAIMFAILLSFGAGNFLAVRRLASDARLVARVRLFVEVEAFIGASVMFVAAALTSLPPAVDLGTHLATWPTVVERVFTLRAPRLISPDLNELAIPQAQARLDAIAATEHRAALPVYVPGAGLTPPVAAADVVWSEYNHNWSGIFVLGIGLLAFAAQAGWRPARHWPLLFIALGWFVLVRSDPESWPLGDINFFAAMRAPEVLQHRLAVLVVFVFGLFEWRVRNGTLAATRAVYVFPISNVVGGVLLLSHSHDLNNTQEALLMELSHLGMGLCGIAAGCARWLEIRADGRLARVAGWVWPTCFVALGLVLLFYRES